MATHEIGGWIVRYLMQYLVNSIWQAPLLLAAGWIVCRMLRRLGPEIQHRVWVAALIFSVLTPLGGLRPSTARVPVLLAGASAPPAYAQAAPSLPGGWGVVHLAPPLYWALLLGYAAFLVCSGLRLGLAYRKTRNLGRNSAAPELSEEASELWQECRRVFAVGGAGLRCSGQIAGPATIGHRKPLLLLPAIFLNQSTRQDLAAALAHECAHLERRDFLLNLLYEAAALPVAFHPAVWIVKTSIAGTRELICDRMAAGRVAGSRAYAHSLLRLAGAICAPAGAAPPYAIGMFDANTLENRIMNLTQIEPATSRRRKFALLAMGAFLLSASGIAALALTVNVEPASSAPTAAANPPAGKVYKVGDGVTAPRLIYAPTPSFPPQEQAKKEKFSGVCVLSLVVDAQGHPRQVHVVRSLTPDFDKKAVETVRQYRFKPAMREGKPVAVGVNIEINFKRF